MITLSFLSFITRDARYNSVVVKAVILNFKSEICHEKKLNFSSAYIVSNLLWAPSRMYTLINFEVIRIWDNLLPFDSEGFVKIALS